MTVGTVFIIFYSGNFQLKLSLFARLFVIGSIVFKLGSVTSCNVLSIKILSTKQDPDAAVHCSRHHNTNECFKRQSLVGSSGHTQILNMLCSNDAWEIHLGYSVSWSGFLVLTYSMC